MIGLSGLITPSLDEMVHVAREMEREGFQLPLLIGGATTSAKHTAVKIAPAYHGTVIHVKDASRSVGVVDRLTRPEHEAGHWTARTAPSSRRNARLRQAPAAQAGPLCRGGASAVSPSTGSAAPIAEPSFLGTRVLRDFPLTEIVPYIDWSPFFMAWELTRQVPGDLRRSEGRRRGAETLRRRQATAGARSSATSC